MNGTVVSRRGFLKGSVLMGVALMSGTFAACGGVAADPKSRIVGTWKGSVNSGFGTTIDLTFTFRQDGTVSGSGQGLFIGASADGKWTVDGNVVSVEEDSGKISTLTLSDDGTYLTDSSGNRYDKQ